MNIIIIGSGLGGLAAGIRLQALGHQVTILEKRDKPGGRAYCYQQDGFTFDGGPTIITAPGLIEDLFTLADRSMSDYVKLVKLDPFYRVRFTDSSVFNYNDNYQELIEQIREFNPGDVQGYQQFCRAADLVFSKGLPLMTKPFHKFREMLKVAPAMIQLQSYKSVAGFVNQYIQDERLRQVFSFHPLLIGGNPFNSTSIYAMIHKLEQVFGIWFAMGGTGALVAALVRLFEEIGGVLCLNAEVEEIVIDEDTRKAKGVILKSQEMLEAEAVVSNGDVAFTYLNLISPKFRRKYSDRQIKSLRHSISLFVVYFGTNRRYNNMAHHEIIMGPNYRELMDDLFRRKHLSSDFSLYLHRPTATDPSLAPAGCDCWYVLSPVPNLAGDTDWKIMAKPYRDRLIQFLENQYMPNLSQHIVTENYIDPLHFQNTLNSYLGSAFSLEPTLMQSAWFRPHNVSEDIPNLYFVGAGTHPGAGIPGVISSAKIVSDLVGKA
ncbi:phytoene desaturase [Arthrospira platensis]|uniref:Phytoene dehydrogenase n=1 Tax=Limnospira platensis NIES-46 TaxID=1236695 RepID=A0A5M3TB78_LIMPL|nr:phytoene desaturase [Arthrospira platensis]AMW29989.1 phytoene dehydrogenase [Arthrospira platensis YZ]KDR53920.1 phytoene dehydrogenase [Arthrospira platensis str. Paraca]MBD2671228.1 phytoene desaturase [Arthrospira platensis FACHB-439]MBD2712178.1 phytoene desaturase [Arthrospira platensis FACHB-835]MDT9184652.1 phytoene desaturase [Limnospira sp. PMC 289.06]MDT9312448.1 phytoene desaturase [Limnospira sp. Paracas R14]QQW27946.1 phytoene desaturase [Arthrospira sp. PCC 9108]